MNKETKISKTLAYWLRHRPDEAGLTLDANGWTSADAVMASLNRDQPVSWDELIAVVETNDKQRYEFSGDLTQIRARQGHSVEIDLALEPAVPPPVLFHGTVGRFIKAIMQEGLRPMNRHHVHLSADEETARRVAIRRGPPVILRVDTVRMTADAAIFHVTGNGVWLTDKVAPRYLSRDGA